MGVLKKYSALFLIFIAIIGVYAIMAVDVRSRARASYLEAEKYMDWHRNPESKKLFFSDSFRKNKSHLDKLLAEKKLTEETYRDQLDALEFERDFHLSESSLKYAYQWYKDTYELFTPPESEWARQAREKAPMALEMWKQELKGQNIPFEDSMFE